MDQFLKQNKSKLNQLSTSQTLPKILEKSCLKDVYFCDYFNYDGYYIPYGYWCSQCLGPDPRDFVGTCSICFKETKLSRQ